MMIKICFVVSDLKQGGAERQLVELIKHIDKTEFDVTLLVYKQEDFFYKDVWDVKGVKIVTHHPKLSGGKLSKFFAYGLFLNRFFRQDNFDIVHTMLYHNSVVTRFFLPFRYTRKIIYGVRNNMDILFKKENRFRRFLEEILFFRSYIVCNTKKAAESFNNLFPKDVSSKISYVYNGYDTNRFSLKSAYRNENTDKLIVGMVGRQCAQKNYIQALDAIRKIDNIELHIWGAEGESTFEIKKYIHEHSLEHRINLHGPSNNIEREYPKFDFLLMTSIFEGCPNVIFEAMLSKLPVIISSSANTDNFVQHMRNGITYDINSTEDLIDKLRLASELNRKDVIDIVESAYSYAIDNFSISAMVGKYSEIYKKVLES